MIHDESCRKLQLTQKNSRAVSNHRWRASKGALFLLLLFGIINCVTEAKKGGTVDAMSPKDYVIDKDLDHKYSTCLQDYIEKHEAGQQGKAFRDVIRKSYVACQNFVAAQGNALAPIEILQVIRANLGQVRRCFVETLKNDPKTTGKITTKWTIAAKSGEIESVTISKSDGIPLKMQSCVTGVIKRWLFPVPRNNKPVNVEYPFVFNPL
jgi:hypothetical protein